MCASLLYLVTLLPVGVTEYCNERICLSVSVCVFVCPCSYLQNYRLIFTRFFVHVTYGHGLVLWQHSDTLHTSGFVGDVTFSRAIWLLDIAVQPKRSAHTAFDLAVNDT